MRRFLRAAIVVAVLFSLGLALAPLSPTAAAPQAAAPQQRGEESTCVPESNKVAYPNVLLLGEETDLTLTVRALCAPEAFPLHVVLVLDASGSMAGQKNADLKNAVKRMVRELNLDERPLIQMGIVEFNNIAKTLCQLTNDSGRLNSCANKVSANGGTSIDQGIREGLKVLSRGRPRGGGSDVREIMVVLSDGGNNAGCQPVIQAANQAKGQKVLIMSVCVGSDCDAACMRQVASSNRYFFQVNDSGAIVQAFIRIAEEVLNINLKRMTVTDILPPNMQLVADSVDPAPDKGDPASGLTWVTSYVPKDGITITFRVRPLETGYHPTNVQAVGQLVDNQNRSRDFTFPLPFVTVLQPFPLATPSEPPPTPTITPSPTPTNTVVVPPTPTPTATPTRVPDPIYLPILLREDCTRTYIYADVVLVLDISTSMDRPTSAGRSKLDASIAAAKDFVRVVDLSPDAQGRYSQIGVVGFNDDAWTEIGLSNNEAAIQRALSDLPKRRNQGTRLDKAFQQGESALFGAGRRPENTAVIVLLTDGLPNRVPLGPDGRQESTVIAAADKVKARDAIVYTIGIGEPTDISPELLTTCATSPEHFFYQADAEDLQHVYNEIAYSFGCPGRHDWSKPWE